jgi:uncharacterized protein (DUF433 family)
MSIDIRNQSLPTVIVRDPKICGGDPTIRGTRIPVEMILVHLRDGTAGKKYSATTRDYHLTASRL